MRKSVFAVIGTIMIIIAVCFVAYALHHPEAFFPWPNSVTYTLFALYGIATVVMFVLAARK